MRIIGDLVLAGFGQLKNARIENLSSDPVSPQNGQVWFNTTDSVYRGYNGTSVITFANGGSTQSIVDALNSEISARTAADAVEATARAAADLVESSARTAAISTVQGNLDTEATARAAADSSEATTRAAADTAETSARIAADDIITGNLNTEVTARQSAVSTVQGNLDTEATARAAADSAETTARIAADAVEATARAAAVTGVQDNLDTESSARAAADALRVLKTGDSMSGNLAFGGINTVTGLAAPTAADHAATKNYVDSTVSGLSWKAAVNAAVADHTTEAHASGKRVLDLTDGKVYVSDGAAWDVGTAAVDGDAVFDRGTETGYVFSGTVWTVFTGTGMVAAGVGLMKTGNQIDVNLGAGIAQLPSDEVGIDIRATGGLLLTLDGTTPSDDTNSQLAIRLSDSSLTLGASGVQVSSAIQTALSTATTDIAAEITNRVAADDAEVTARTAAITTVTNSLNTEVTARQSAVSTVQGNLDTEATARASADTAETSARIAADDAESTTRAAAITTVTNNLNTEITARQAADSTESTTRAAADTAIHTRLTDSQFLYDGSVAATSHTVAHGLGVKYCQVIVIDSSDKVIIPDSITFSSTSSLLVDFISAITCKVVVTAPKAL